MKTKTNVRSGGTKINHNQTVRLKTNIRAAGIHLNHNLKCA
jgi:hypothetical protein